MSSVEFASDRPPSAAVDLRSISPHARGARGHRRAHPGRARLHVLHRQSRPRRQARPGSPLWRSLSSRRLRHRGRLADRLAPQQAGVDLERTTGADLLQPVCRQAADQGASVLFRRTWRGIAALGLAELQRRIPISSSPAARRRASPSDWPRTLPTRWPRAFAHQERGSAWCRWARPSRSCSPTCCTHAAGHRLSLLRRGARLRLRPCRARAGLGQTRETRMGVAARERAGAIGPALRTLRVRSRQARPAMAVPRRTEAELAARGELN